MRRTAEHLTELELEEIGRAIRAQDREYVCVLDVEEGEVLMFERSVWPDHIDEDIDESEVPAWAVEPRRRARAVWDDTTGRYVPLPSRSPDGRLRRFYRELPSGKLSDAVYDAMQGRGAFRRVKDVLAREGQLDLWHTFEARADVEDARDWLRAEGLLPDEDGDAPPE